MLQMIAVLMFGSILTTLEMRLKISWRQRMVKLIVLAFIVSIPMTWYELYKVSVSVCVKIVLATAHGQIDRPGFHCQYPHYLVWTVATFYHDNFKMLKLILVISLKLLDKTIFGFGFWFL